MDKLFAALAFLVLAGFLGILGWMVPRANLLAIIFLTLLLCGIDFVVSSRRK
ncbi:hypothetical protein SAMN04490244_103386 [Tranquillimonas rosea]|uniref:Uncharacterized protein n=1 Tax=Tranquillimonas rosea TaxID=641238 RepID=A0A1H9STP9_9RHOB|nr:hypothetical protein SAMN04490244_103386 [Tranquillimonas rosea]